MKKSSIRIFSCIECQSQTFICSTCDRGNIYCNDKCALIAHKKHSKRASERYQNTRNGRFNHAKRQRHYITQKKKMTHQGSKVLKACALISVLTNNQVKKQIKAVDNIFYCHFCGEPCLEFVRKGFLRRNSDNKNKLSPRFSQAP